MRFAYCDPPYLGQSARHYKNHPDFAGEVDHCELFRKLELEYPDGWALSASAPSLFELLPMAPEGSRIAAWVKPFAIFKPGVNPAYTWEPVIFKGGRKRDRTQPTVKDHHVASITLKKGLVGVKPESFCFWVFNLLGAQPDDELHDLFPGSRAVSTAWEKWRSA